MTRRATWTLTYSCADPGESLPRLMDHLRKQGMPLAHLTCDATTLPARVFLTFGYADEGDAQHFLRVACKTIGVEGATILKPRTKSVGVGPVDEPASSRATR